MATDKKSFVIYCDLIHTVSKMPDDKAGLLFKHLLAYVNDLNPVTDDLIVDLTFEPIKQQLKRDLVEWSNTKTERSESGVIGNLKRWHSDLYNRYAKGEPLNELLAIAKHRKTSHSDKQQSLPIANIAVNDTVTVNVNDTVIKERVNKFTHPTLEQINLIISEKKEAEAFLNYYTANGWMVGKNKMKSWEAAAKMWISRSGNFTPNPKTGKLPFDPPPNDPNYDKRKAWPSVIWPEDIIK